MPEEKIIEFFDAGYLLYDYATYDAFNEKAREMYWKQAKEGLFDQGFDSWWCDSTEPFSGPDWGGAVKREPWERFQLVEASTRNTWILLWPTLLPWSMQREFMRTRERIGRICVY